MQVSKRDIDKMVQFINYIANKPGVDLSAHDKAVVKEINEAYDKAMEWHRGQLEYKKEYRKEKQKEDPFYSRSKAFREKYERKSEDPS